MIKMMAKNKKGNTLTNIILFVFIAIIGIIGFLYANSAMKGDASLNAAERIAEQVVNVTITILNSTIGLLVGTKGLEPSLAFLRIIVFLLVSIVVVGSFNAINIFGEGDSSKWTNLLVGIIVAVIGVRFLPNDIWLALTAPSSAFVFALMMTLPLVPLIFFLVKVKVDIIRKITVAAYLIGLFILFYSLKDQFYRNITLIFMVVAILLLLFDSQFIKYVRKQASKTQVEKLKYSEGVIQRKELREQLKKFREVQADTSASESDKKHAKSEVKRITKIIKDLEE